MRPMLPTDYGQMDHEGANDGLSGAQNLWLGIGYDCMRVVCDGNVLGWNGF